jgi:TatD DNase family protein
MTWLTDAHIHLSDIEYSTDLEYLLVAMDKMKIRACCVSVDNSSSKSTLELGQRSPLILPFVGIHPENAYDNLNEMTELITKNYDKISGIGEIGLDKTYVSNEVEFSRQVSVFQKMLSLAEKLNKPVSIHSRKTLDEIFSLLPSYSLQSILLHWFSGSKKQLQKAMELDCFVSYGPAMIYSGDKKVLLSQTDLNKILLETDGPVRFSRCFGLKTAQITFLPSVLFCAAGVLNKSYDEMLLIIEKNFNSYLGV